MPLLIKRRDSRYPISGTFEGSELPSFHGRKKAVTFQGQVKDVSNGGFCLLSTHAPKESGLLQGPLKLAQMPAHIPTLVQVRWVERTPEARHYRIGLQYVI